MNICYSGGAKGADTIFGILALQNNHDLIHYSFQNHSTSWKTNVVELNYMQLCLADKHLKVASKFLERTTGQYEYVRNLLRRNYYQIKDTERVYAVSYLDDNRRVAGGTGWACTMAMFNNIKEIYVYDQDKKVWFKYNSYSESLKAVDWDEIDKPPPPFGRYTGIGSVEITENGINAIQDLYDGNS